uniref:Uncharacterized protein n=1 Tax=Picea glauca TaxID=3330 RepID=A0A101M4Z6_PICGL|nr:hypothetical protein ABT39_MTgene813 [Picea glauca]
MGSPGSSIRIPGFVWYGMISCIFSLVSPGSSGYLGIGSSLSLFKWSALLKWRNLRVGTG